MNGTIQKISGWNENTLKNSWIGIDPAYKLKKTIKINIMHKKYRLIKIKQKRIKQNKEFIKFIKRVKS